MSNKIKFSNEIDKIISNSHNYIDDMDIEQLEKIIDYLSMLYYNTGKSKVSDKIYDYLITVLEKKDPNNKLLSKIGYKVKNGKKLPYYAPSLDKIKDEKKLKDWLLWILEIYFQSCK